MLRRLVLFALSLSLLVLPRIALAQQLVADPPKTEKPSPEVEKKALALLDTISEQVTNLRSPANRVRNESLIADLLWTRDEKRARALFKSAANDLIDTVANLDLGEPDVYQQLATLTQLRSELITRLARYDPDAALSLLHSTHLGIQAESRMRWYADAETNLEMQLAAVLSKQNPARTLELARSSLPRGVTYGLISLLNQLQQKDPKSAQTLYKEMVDQIKREDLGQDYNLAEAAWNLLQFQPPQANEDLYKDLIGTIINSTLAITPDNQNSINMAQNAYNQLQSVMPLIEKYAPARATALRDWSQNAERSFDPNTRMYQEINKISQNGSVDDMLALAARYSGDAQLQIYSQAAWKAMANGDTNRARQIINDLVADPVQRRQMLTQIDNQLLETSINQDKIADARQILSGVKSTDQRVAVLIRLATVLSTKGDKKGALELLAEAKADAETAPQGFGRMGTQLQLIQAYSAFDQDQSFAMLQKLIGRFNELIAAAATLDGFDAHYLKDEEWIMPGNTQMGNLITNLNYVCAHLAQLDIDRALSLVNQIERSELRLTASVLMARAVLGGTTSSQPTLRKIIVGEG